MIGKVCPRGENLAGLICYLYGPGRREHTDPHIVAGYRDPAGLEPALRPDGGRDFRRLTGLLKYPHDALGSYGCAKPVWHCPVRAAPGDRLLPDQEWARVARDVMDRAGLSRHGEEDEAVRWIAVRHGPDHVHIVAMLARQDRQRVSTWNDRYGVRDACLAAEQRYGLRSTALADRSADRSPTPRGEGEIRAARPGRAAPGYVAPPRGHRRRGSRQRRGLLRPPGPDRDRCPAAVQHQGPRPGHRVLRLPARRHDQDRGPVWYGGGKLATDLSWPELRRRWAGPRHRGPRLTPQGRDDLWRHAAGITDAAAAQITNATSPDGAADAAWAAGDALRVTAAALGSPILAQAADAYDRAARQQHGRIPSPTPAGNQLRHAARTISAHAYLTGNKALAPLVLIIRLAVLAETLAGLRDAQHRAHQGDAALRAARHLHEAVSTSGPVPGVPGRTRPAATPAADAITANFPSSPFGSGRPPASQPGTGDSKPRRPRRPAAPRPRGPTR